MNKIFIGFIFILVGLCYGSLAIETVYNHTVGYLIEHDWIKPPVDEGNGPQRLLGPKQTILLYGAILIIIGLFIIWNWNS